MRSLSGSLQCGFLSAPDMLAGAVVKQLCVRVLCSEVTLRTSVSECDAHDQRKRQVSSSQQVLGVAQIGESCVTSGERDGGADRDEPRELRNHRKNEPTQLRTTRDEPGAMK